MVLNDARVFEYSIQRDTLSTHSGKHWFPELEYLKIEPIHYLEIGSLCGGSATSFLYFFAENENTSVTCIDPWEDHAEYTEYKGLQNSHYQHFLYNIKATGRDSQVTIIKDYSFNAISKLNDDYYDIIFIDGNHSYSRVKGDGKLVIPKLKKDRWLIFDDYHPDWKDSIRAIEEFKKNFKDLFEFKFIKNEQVFLIKR